jgi:hypothetical protein
MRLVRVWWSPGAVVPGGGKNQRELKSQPDSAAALPPSHLLYPVSGHTLLARILTIEITPPPPHPTE